MNLKNILHKIIYSILTLIFCFNGLYSYFKAKKYLIKYNDINKYERIIIISEYISNKFINYRKAKFIEKYFIHIGVNLLINFFNNNKLKFGIIKNITPKNFEKIMQTTYINEIYYFGHSQKHKLALSKTYRLKNLKKYNNTEKYIFCQFSCNGKNGMIKNDVSISSFAKKYHTYPEDMFFFENWLWIKDNFRTFYFSNK
ncbi:MAG: hypothetical protein PHR48_03625 [Candidatus ainarchaeum sp.]|nr:hypothetical protein [Candidatus ainarchaeum sp.]